ncbi:MAG: proliferating cell nuclear antigen (pcna) [archaeon]
MLELRQATFFKIAVESIASFIPEGNFRFSDKGISFKAIDPSQVVLVDYFVDKKHFDKYVIEPNFVGVDLVELNKILQRAMPDDKMLLDVSDAEMKIRFESDMKRSFRLPLIDVSDDDVKIPSIEYEAKIDISAASFKEVLKDASLFGSSIVLKATDGKFFIEAKGSQGVMESEATKVSHVSSKKEITAKFSLNFLQNIVRQAENEKQLTIELKNDAAMRVSYLIGPGKIVFYLAHMIL